MRHGGRLPRAAEVSLAVCLLAAWTAAGCASTRAAIPRLDRIPKSPPSQATHDSAGASRSSGAVALTAESWDPGLSSALAALALGPTADREYQVALQYRRLGILDTAYSHLLAAVKLNPKDARAYDIMARIWRDWGFPQQGLRQARRAVQLAPGSAPAANTLGTLLQGVGRLVEARLWYERAAAIDPDARYALDNLCYATIMQRSPDAVTECRHAQAAAPDSGTSRNNLALAYAAQGDLARARETLEQSDDPATASYNMGILYLSARQYQQAAAAFASALHEKPGFALAARRAKEARAAARVDGTETHNGND